MDWPALRAEISAATARVCELLRALPSGDLPLARVTWTAAELGAHLAGLPGRYVRMSGEPHPFPASLADENQREVDAVATRDPVALAGLLEAEMASFLAASGADGQRRAWYFTVPHTVEGVGASLLSELLLHGTDLARALGRPWPISRVQAVTCLRGVLPAVVLAVDPRAARTATGTYHVALRGGDDWAFRVRDGELTVARERPARADLHLSVDPVGFLLNSVGLVGSARFALSGGVLAWGRRLWLAPRFSRLFVPI
ncbi:hypothetical protein FKR81_34890 [Lentzea tibetensis]|uniref:Mycothiol-dependent maleylpyruvate isomerase metal-binding domain-containing protein n=1 Tax=Lentzea tibetensis TaxID=2591470 RepID=A0A563EKM2_9PSEU|nr:hypothetical protein [Lentzea tibetensis]TWP46774.1 hypothetical protein FKR81_34890 [Lentzea tibetensis]